MSGHEYVLGVSMSGHEYVLGVSMSGHEYVLGVSIVPLSPICFIWLWNCSARVIFVFFFILFTYMQSISITTNIMR